MKNQQALDWLNARAQGFVFKAARRTSESHRFEFVVEWEHQGEQWRGRRVVGGPESVSDETLLQQMLEMQTKQVAAWRTSQCDVPTSEKEAA
jgi:hypothetical protein